MAEEESADNGEKSELARSGGKTIRRPPASARCEKCRHEEVSWLPTYAAGSGVAVRPIADDVFCRYCGHIGTPVYDLTKKTRLG